MALRKKVGRAGGPVAPHPLTPEGHRQVIRPPRPTDRPGQPARIAADNGEPNRKPSGHQPARGQDRAG